MRSRFLLWLSLLLCLVAAASPARAESTPPGYQEAIRAAVQEYQAGNWTEAIMLFRRAHALAPSARTHRGLGLCYFEARKYVVAVEHLQAALDDRRRPLSADQRDAVQAALTRARTMVGEVVVHASPPGAQLIVDGGASAQVGRPIALDAGQHTIEVRAAGYASQQRTLDVVGEQRSELSVELEGAAGKANPAGVASSAGVGREVVASEAAPAEHGAGGVSAGPIIVLGVGAAALGGALVTGLMEHSKEGELVDAGCETLCGPEHEATREDARTLQTTTNVLLAAGGAVLAAGAVWLWLDLAGGDSEAADVSASALCTTDGCAGALRGKF